jgi:diguanylate cyclase (GGDEF)-like protein
MTEATDKSLLLVDDEASVRHALRREFRATGYRILEADSAETALAVLETEPTVGVVIADFRMPGMNGAELLGFVRQRWPDTMRVMLTGQADMDAVVAAINCGAVYRFLLKPWDPADLLHVVKEAFRLRDLEEENRKLASGLKEANARLTALNADLEARVEEKATALLKATYHDAVTGLPNRLLLDDRLAQTLKRAERTGSAAAVLLFDIERYQLVNESFGYAIGDALLKRVAERLCACVRAADTVARLSSDEFCIVLSDASAAEEQARVAERILEAMRHPFVVADSEVFLTAGIGISLYPGDGDDGETLIRHAEAALLHMKEHGGNGYEYYAPEINRRSVERLSLEAELRRAVAEEQFLLHYQPQAEVASGRIVGVEALLRWQHPQRGLVPPLQFIPLLEETGLIEPVGEWALAEACRTAVRLRNVGHPLKMAVNLSARQMHQGKFLDTVRRQALANNLDIASGLLELEITESLLMHDVSLAQRTLAALNEMGVRIAIDDFGTGYSSLSYLTRFPIDCIKIDRSFVSEVSNNHQSRAVVQAIIGMAHSLGHRLVAEGVETAAQRQALLALGCEEFQGYLLSRPVPEAELMRLLGEAPLLPALTWISSSPPGHDVRTAGGIR